SQDGPEASSAKLPTGKASMETSSGLPGAQRTAGGGKAVSDPANDTPERGEERPNPRSPAGLPPLAGVETGLGCQLPEEKYSFWQLATRPVKCGGTTGPPRPHGEGACCLRDRQEVSPWRLSEIVFGRRSWRSTLENGSDWRGGCTTSGNCGTSRS